MGADGRDGQVSLAALLGAFSPATDLGLGQPMEHVLRSWRIASRLGERPGPGEAAGRPGSPPARWRCSP